MIDEKLIRMKELAEQAATGTYDSTQRLMIESEYQAMASEITRIANATDFNGVKLLDGTLSGEHNGSGLVSRGKMKIHFGTANDSAEDYYYITIDDCTAAALGVGNQAAHTKPETRTVYVNQAGEELEPVDAYFNLDGTFSSFLDDGNGNVYLVTDVLTDGNEIFVYRADFPPDYVYHYAPQGGYYFPTGPVRNYYVDYQGERKQLLAAESALPGVGWTLFVKDTAYLDANGNVYTPEEVTPKKVETGQMVTEYGDAYTVSTQEAAQRALVGINNAIVSKDKIRAHLGAMQNRLENTITNLNVQAENLQAAESRISDVDVATEMTEFVRNQILTQSAVAMLSQANSLPQMAMQLIGG